MGREPTMKNAKYILHGIACDGSGKKVNEYDTREEAQEAMEDWLGWFNYYKDTHNLEGSESDFWIEEPDKTNDYMNELGKKLNAYERERKAYEDSKEEARAQGHEALMDWYDNEPEKPEYPLTGGQSKAWRMWYWNEREEMNFDDFVWESEAKDFIDTLRAAGVKTFTVTNQSTALMENMHWFQQNGCMLMGLCEVEETDEWNRKNYGNKMGVRFVL